MEELLLTSDVKEIVLSAEEYQKHIDMVEALRKKEKSLREIQHGLYDNRVYVIQQHQVKGYNFTDPITKMEAKPVFISTDEALQRLSDENYNAIKQCKEEERKALESQSNHRSAMNEYYEKGRQFESKLAKMSRRELLKYWRALKAKN